jgi:aryl carrier-like protein
MNLIKHFFLSRKIKSELYQMIQTHIDLKNKKISNLKKTDLDSVELLTLLQHIETRWGKINLADLYQARSFDDIVLLILKNQS